MKFLFVQNRKNSEFLTENLFWGLEKPCLIEIRAIGEPLKRVKVECLYLPKVLAIATPTSPSSTGPGSH